jgi:hypothetical protein
MAKKTTKKTVPQKGQVKLDDQERAELGRVWEEIFPRIKDFSSFSRELMVLGIERAQKDHGYVLKGRKEEENQAEEESRTGTES